MYIFYNHLLYFEIVVFPQSLLLSSFLIFSVNGIVLSDAIRTKKINKYRLKCNIHVLNVTIWLINGPHAKGKHSVPYHTTFPAHVPPLLKQS